MRDVFDLIMENNLFDPKIIMTSKLNNNMKYILKQ